MNVPLLLPTFRWLRLAGLALIVLGLCAAPPAAPGQQRSPLPRFTEEREAAALFFVGKQLPALVPLLEELKKNQRPRYEQEISRIFQATEMLADLRDDPKRYDLELKIWKTENKAHLLIAQMNVQSDAERQQLEVQLRDLARELVNLEIQVLELRATQLKEELDKVNEKLAKSQKAADELARERFKSFLEKVRKPAK